MMRKMTTSICCVSRFIWLDQAIRVVRRLAGNSDSGSQRRFPNRTGSAASSGAEMLATLVVVRGVRSRGRLYLVMNVGDDISDRSVK